MNNEKKWYVGAMNDGLFVIDAPPRPSTDDIAPNQNVTVIAALGTNQVAADLLVAEHNKRVEAVRTIEQNRADIRQRALSRDHVIDLVLALIR